MNLQELLPKPLERGPLTDLSLLLRLSRELVREVTGLRDEVDRLKATLGEDADLVVDEAEAESQEELAEDSPETEEVAEPESDDNVEAGVVAAMTSVQQGALYE